MAKLTAKGVAAAKPGRHGDGRGLWLVVSPTGAKRWVYRFTLNGRVSELGLGSYPEVALGQARGLATEARIVHKAGVSPVAAKRAGAAEGDKPTFGKIADAYIEAKASEWRSRKHHDQWITSLTRDAAPLRNRPVDEIDTNDILSLLQPIWKKTPESASRLRGRIEAVIDAARARGHIEPNIANPARWRGHLSMLLPKRTKLSRTHFAAMDYREVPAFIVRLRAREATGSLAVEFLILTAARTGEVRGAVWSEIDVEARLWTIPAERTKAGRIHRVPLSDPAMAILRQVAKIRSDDFVVPGKRKGRSLYSSTLDDVLRSLNVDATIHGFRSSFRDWAGNETNHPREVAEAALAHVVGDSAEQAYRRSDALAKRRALMDEWAEYCCGGLCDAE